MASVASKWEWVDYQAHAEVAPESHPQHERQLQQRAKAQRTLKLRTADADAPQPYSPARRASGFSAPAFIPTTLDGAGVSSLKHVKGDTFDLCVLQPDLTTLCAASPSSIAHSKAPPYHSWRLGFSRTAFAWDAREAPACQVWLSNDSCALSHHAMRACSAQPSPHRVVCGPTAACRLPGMHARCRDVSQS